MGLMAERFREMRKQRGYTQADIVKAFGVSQQQVAKWERGNSDASAETLTRLARLLQCSTDYLLGLSDLPEEQFKPQGLSPEEWRLVDLYRRGELPQLLAQLARELVGQEPQERLVEDRRE